MAVTLTCRGPTRISLESVCCPPAAPSVGFASTAGGGVGAAAAQAVTLNLSFQLPFCELLSALHALQQASSAGEGLKRVPFPPDQLRPRSPSPCSGGVAFGSHVSRPTSLWQQQQQLVGSHVSQP
ncbi:unnamed protein product, partial [Polarella glacialis]